MTAPSTSTDLGAREGPLRDLRVLVVGGTRAAVTTASLLADYGSDVVIVEPVGGHPVRRMRTASGPAELLWGSVARGCRTMQLTGDDVHGVARALAADVDVVIADHVGDARAAFGVDLEQLRSVCPDLITVTVSPYGDDGPNHAVPGNDVTAEAFGGLTFITGHPDRAPLHTDYPVGAAISALIAALGITAALRARRAGRSTCTHVEVAMYEGVLRMLEFLPAFRSEFGWPSQRTNSTSDYQVPVNRWPTADGGWLSFTGNTEDVVQRFFRALGHGEFETDPRFCDNAARVRHRDELEVLIGEWFAKHTRADVVRAMESEGVPIAEILDVSEVFADPHVAERGTLVALDDGAGGTVRIPGVAGRFSRTAGALRHLGTVEVGAHDLVADWNARPGIRRERSGATGSEDAGPLSGLRVLDIGNVIAGPLSATLLSDLGADVVKVERPKRGDLFRAQAPLKDGVSVWWKVCGRGKRSIALDLKNDEDLSLFKDLVREADVLVENFVPGVAASLGIDAESLATVNPRLVYVSISGYGQFGPKAHQRAFGRNAEGFGGMASITGYPGDAPQHTGFPVADCFSAVFAAFGALAALYDRDELGSGQGQHLDVALFESVLRFLEPAVSMYGSSGEVWERGRGRCEPGFWRRACPTSDGAWVSVAASESASADVIARWLELDVTELMDDESVETKTGAMTAETLLRSAAEHGIAAARISTIDDLMGDEHLRARAMLVSLPDPDFGTVLMPGVVPRFDGRRLGVRHRAPQIDEHRTEVLADWLGGRTGATRGE